MLTLLPFVAVQVRLASFQGPHSGGNSHLRKIQKFTNEHRIFLSTLTICLKWLSLLTFFLLRKGSQYDLANMLNLLLY